MTRLPLLLLLPLLRPAPALPGPAPALPGPAWRCPLLAPLPPSVSCACDLPHTLRCDGALPAGDQRAALASILRQVAALPPAGRVALLDLSLRNLTRLPGRLLQRAAVEGLVISSGQLANISARAFQGLEERLTALGLPGNQLSTVPVQALAPLRHLSRLDLSGNRLPSLPALPSLPDLEFLALSGNRIANLAAGVFQALPHLQTLQLGGNRLSSAALYHYNLQHLSYLSTLELSSNLVSGPLAPPALDLFPPNLRSLDLSLNSVTRIASRAFAALTGLTSLSLEGNLVEEVEGGAFLGLPSLSSLDLSHNSILTLAPDSLAGMPSLTHLNLAHNHLQVVGADLVPGSPLLASLQLMDNDITTVEEGVLAGLHGLTGLNLAGNPLSCDCRLTGLHSWLQGPLPSPAARASALCATPPALSNAPLAALPRPPACTEEDRQADTQIDSPRGDYYEYYSEPAEGAVPVFLSSAELQLASSSYQPATGELAMEWRVDAAAVPYTCDMFHVFLEPEELAPVLVLQRSLACSSASEPRPRLLSVTVPLAAHNLSLSQPYIFCISLLQDSSVIPGCSGALHLGREEEVTQVRSLEQQAGLAHLHANVSAAGSEVAVSVEARVPAALEQGCRLHLSLSSPTAPPRQIASATTNCSTGLYTFSSLPPHTYYNVCASLQPDPAAAPRRAQCLLAAAPRLRSAPRSVMPLLLTLVFLALGIACLTVLYLIVRRHREDSKHRTFLRSAAVSPLMGLCWRLSRRRGRPAFFLDDADDEAM